MELLSSSVLSDDEKSAINRLSAKIRADEKPLARLNNYYEGEQRLRHIGLAVPPELRSFETVINVPGMAVTEPTIRQSLRAFYKAGDSTKEDPALREAWEVNNLDSESTLCHQEEKIFGRTFVTVGANEDDDGHLGHGRLLASWPDRAALPWRRAARSSKRYSTPSPSFREAWSSGAALPRVPPRAASAMNWKRVRSRVSGW